ncbi:polysaccharide pyruvyl transferase family protein [Bradyrhizobium sp. 1]|uniref:polysaccharide pyruvyl transferase family protein n=1 Tax=Bradyrhizobium sp. 1 TaxID=241591 RepID=UPI001FF79162|nr:polysaccharide pyruvyl transferase family protein [Bradyrhizobium sp. 1]MCK1396153.1 polysaccharide pyruvyl transferase family protein [Bradyrhizobium sp. 1]
MRTITLFDTSAASDNLGDQIIVEAVRDVIDEVLPDAYVYTVATHEYITGASKKLLKASDFSIVAGTNILASNMEARTLWKLLPWDAFAIGHAVLLGCGWLNYMNPPNAYSRWLLNRILSAKHLHATRDDYTKEKLAGIGRQTANTSCPTMWRLTEAHCAEIPVKQAGAAVITLTHYLGKPEIDRTFVELVKRHYGQVYFWSQQCEDMEYFESLSVPGYRVVKPSLRGFDELLEGTDIDFIGTRLHGGIRAMQKKRRALILAVDNRATEISKGTQLPITRRDDFAYMESWITNPQPTRIVLPQAEIDRWKAQFK